MAAKDKYPHESEFVPTFTFEKVIESNIYDKKITRNDLSEDQTAALDVLFDLCKDGVPLVTLAGFAGTGKSTLIPLVSELLGDTSSTAFCAFTGKAANVLGRKMRAAGIANPGQIGTIHSLMYAPLTNQWGGIVGWQRKRELVGTNNRKITRIIVDEASMVGERLLEDMQSYDIPILAVGDHGQLPPIQDESILNRPDIALERIHRHAENNPILKLSAHIREWGDLPKDDSSSEALRYVRQHEVMDIVGETYERLGMDMAVLVRRNVIRKNFNLMPRDNPEPEVGDIVICLKNNPPVYNGMRGVLREIALYKEHWYKAKVYFPDDGMTVTGLLNRYQFGRDKTIESALDLHKYPSAYPLAMLFDFGLSLTVHKAQGSAFKEVVLCPERWSNDNLNEYRQWLYTAVTRAVDRLTIVR